MPTDSDILRKSTPQDIRDEIERMLRLDLIGPAGGPDEEVAESRVSDRYLCGALAPAGSFLQPEEQDRLAEAGSGDDDEGVPDEEIAGRAALLPSSMGLSFTVDGSASELRATVGWGRYLRTDSETLLTEKTGEPRLVWKRIPFEAAKTVRLSAGRLEDWTPDPDLPGVSLRGVARRNRDLWVVSLFLVNGQRSPKKSKDRAWLFQAQIEVASPDDSPVFHCRPHEALDDSLAEDQSMEMLYRRVAEFGVGHGVAVTATAAEDDPRRAVRLRTSAVPRLEVPRVEAPTTAEVPRLAEAELDMKRLGDLSQSQAKEALNPLADAYGQWIVQREQQAQASGDLKGFAEQAERNLEGCRTALRRMREGVTLLSNDEVAFEAFRFMNRAMWLQRIHSKSAEAARRDEPAELENFDLPANRSWYPFQLAFILLNLASSTDLHHPDRSDASLAVADLLFFPTGGGKTEAYLGLAAYVTGLRRLQGQVGGRDGEHGLAVLMRYTLRLLTLQQFQRATTLICACEKIRREAAESGDGRWGTHPFRIGLWVGRGVTPNTTDQSHEAVKLDYGEGFRKKGSIAVASGSPYQLVSCPWCGSKIEAGRDIVVETFRAGRGRTLQYCGDRLGRCLFSRKQSPQEGLPVLVVDEEIYRDPPSLMIATVDKFAQMPWKGEIQTLYGQVTGRCERHGFRSPDLEDSNSHPKTRTGQYPAAKTVDVPLLRPPDLIIQDELHLISGPLGTLVGLYETAIDDLCGWRLDGKRIRPKLIASTATIRRAADQVHALYRRRVQVFPPPGLEISDNFFSRQRPPSDEKPGRVYLGICAQGRRMKATLIRTYAVLMSASQRLFDQCGEAADPWMTLIGYFNSLRELGGMRRLVDDDVASRLRRMDERGLANRGIWPTSVEELTSRKGSTDIPLILDRLEVPFIPAGSDGGKKPKKFPLDVVLATNMVSVGVDVQRLGLMVVCGQPKSTAEYIQATSRVGRRYPGLVVTVYNWTRPRDLSHYERFEYYHATFYKHVEALSVTPFAPRALDRALFGVLVSLIRLAGLEFNPNSGAGRIDAAHPVVRDAVRAIADRAHAVTQRADVRDEVVQFLNARLDQWSAEATKTSAARPLGYREVGDRTKGLLRQPAKEPWGEFTCLNSLRNVEMTVPLILRDHPRLDVEPAFEGPGGES